MDEIERITRERDDAQANYQFMVNRAADEKLDGYRELGQRAADAERRAETAERERDGLAEAIRTAARPRDSGHFRFEESERVLKNAGPGWTVLAVACFASVVAFAGILCASL